MPKRNAEIYFLIFSLDGQSILMQEDSHTEGKYGVIKSVVKYKAEDCTIEEAYNALKNATGISKLDLAKSSIGDKEVAASIHPLLTVYYHFFDKYHIIMAGATTIISSGYRKAHNLKWFSVHDDFSDKDKFRQDVPLRDLVSQKINLNARWYRTFGGIQKYNPSEHYDEDNTLEGILEASEKITLEDIEGVKMGESNNIFEAKPEEGLEEALEDISVTLSWTKEDENKQPNSREKESEVEYDEFIYSPEYTFNILRRFVRKALSGTNVRHKKVRQTKLKEYLVRVLTGEDDDHTMKDRRVLMAAVTMSTHDFNIINDVNTEQFKKSLKCWMHVTTSEFEHAVRRSFLDLPVTKYVEYLLENLTNSILTGDLE
jgi:hypothetical protein